MWSLNDTNQEIWSTAYYLHVRHKTIVTNNSFHRTQTLLFHCSTVYTVEPWYNNGSRDRPNAFAFTRFCIKVFFHIFYFFYNKEYSSFCPGLAIWGTLYQGSTLHGLFFVLHHFCVCLSCSYTTCKLCCLSFIQMWFCLWDKSPSRHPQCAHTYHKWTGELP